CWTLSLPLAAGARGAIESSISANADAEGASPRRSAAGAIDNGSAGGVPDATGRFPSGAASALPTTAVRNAVEAGSGATQSDLSRWHIRLFIVIALDGVRPISPGIEPSAATVLASSHPEVTVIYSLKRPWLPGFPWSVVFRTEPAGAAVPPMVLVAHPRAVPLSVDDGQI